MKKKSGRWGDLSPHVRKTLWIMKLTLLLMVSAMFASAAGVYSQNTRLTLKMENKRISEVFDAIEKQSEFYFFYNRDNFDDSRIVSVEVEGEKIDEILNKLFNRTSVTWEISDRNILIRTKADLGKPILMQQQQISGKVTGSTGEPLPGVTVLIKGTTSGTITDIDGQYSISNVPADGTLVFSFIGMKSQEVSIQGRTVIHVVLQAETYGVDEVVVVGYGTQQKVNLTGAVSSVRIGENMASRALTNVSSGLAGMVPGLTVTQNTGMAGNDAASLIIRGLGTPNNSTPLVVVDGMPDVDINKLNMNDIESVSVLKDASSSAVYGSRAANGVILITTKRGQSGKIQLNYTGSMASRYLTNYYTSLDDYPRVLELHNMALMNAGKARRFMDGTIEQWMAMEHIDPIRFPNTDWWDVIYKTGMLQNHTISATGGNDKMNFYISVGEMLDNGVSINTDFSRKNFRTNLDYKILENLKIGTTIDGTWTNQEYGNADGLNNMGSSNVREDFYKQTPGVTVRDEQGRYGGHMAYMENNLSRNQYATLMNMHNQNERQQFVGNILGEWEPIKGLTVRLDYGLNFLNGFLKSWSVPFVRWNFQTNVPLDVITSNGGISNRYDVSYKTLLQSRINYTTDLFAGHRLSAMAVYSEEYWFTRYLTGSRQDRIHPDLSELNGALSDKPSASGTSTSEGLRSVIGRINYSIKDKYLLEGNLRGDGSSKFLPGYQWSVFPSISAGWRISQEGFFKSLSNNITNLKIRGSWGILGNNSGVGRYEQRDSYILTNYSFGQTLNLGASSSKIINYDFTWERTRVTNLGVDLTLFEKLSAEIDFYDKLTSNIIRGSELSTILSSNYTSPNTNIGELQNRGLELNLSWRDKVGKIDYRAQFNYAYNKNKLLSWNQRLGYGVPFLNYPYSFTYTYLATGIAQTWSDIWNSPYQGNDYFAPGDILYKDVNGDGQITNADRVAYRNSPRSFFNSHYSLHFDASWKGFNVSMLIQASTGGKDFWIDWFKRVYPNDSRYQYNTVHVDNWSVFNRNAELTRLVIGTGGNNELESTYWLYKKDYLRMKNLQVGYTLPKTLLEQIKFAGVRIFVSGENIFTLTRWPGVDPEKAGGTGLVSNPYPLTRSYSIGVNLTI